MKTNIIIVGRHGGQAGSFHANIGDLILKTHSFLDQDPGFNVAVEEETIKNFLFDSVQAVPEMLDPELEYIVIVFGGDGTMLSAVKKYLAPNVKFLGVNQGRLGFITDLPGDVEPWQIAKIILGNTSWTEERTLLQVVGPAPLHKEMDAGQLGSLSLNDVTFTRLDGRMIEFSIYLDEVFAYRARGDGLMISTPTGSTAYALSAGGAILSPCTNVFQLLVMMPQSLSHRPIIFNDDKQVMIQLHTGAAAIHGDGNEFGAIKPNELVLVRKSKQAAQFLHPNIKPIEYDYLNTLREKLNWQLTPGKEPK